MKNRGIRPVDDQSLVVRSRGELLVALGISSLFHQGDYGDLRNSQMDGPYQAVSLVGRNF